MGRGRQKAKHQKVARQLKYHTSDIDVTALQRELSTRRPDGDYSDYTAYSDDSEDDESAAS